MKNRNKIDSMLIIGIVILVALSLGIGYVRNLKGQIAEQEQLKQEMVMDNDSLTKQVVELRKQVELLQEKTKSQQESIERL